MKDWIGKMYMVLLVILLFILYLNTEACTPLLLEQEGVLVELVLEKVITYEIDHYGRDTI